jgi:hypothetical protein
MGSVVGNGAVLHCEERRVEEREVLLLGGEPMDEPPDWFDTNLSPAARRRKPQHPSLPSLAPHPTSPLVHNGAPPQGAHLR